MYKDSNSDSKYLDNMDIIEIIDNTEIDLKYIRLKSKQISKSEHFRNIFDKVTITISTNSNEP